MQIIFTQCNPMKFVTSLICSTNIIRVQRLAQCYSFCITLFPTVNNTNKQHPIANTTCNRLLLHVLFYIR
uniref:Uncharacterized protein n=1 Tax=Arundo donax TaxID=35708 RepID=A0A0A8ZHU3_ARUDO